MSEAPLFVARGIRKAFPGVQALDGVDFEVRAGEIHALLGVNGAGKSTLVKVMSGAYAPDGGELLLRGQRFAPRTTAEAMRQGIVVVYQERTLIPHLSAAQNILLGSEPTRFGVVDERSILATAQALAHQLGVRLDLRQEVRRLGAGERQLVDILRVLHSRPVVLILDEPTAALSQSETARLFTILRGFRAQGIGIVFVSHRLDEVFALCDRVTVLRDGRVISSTAISAITKREVIRLMVNREVELEGIAPRAAVVGEPLLELRGLSGAGFREVSLALHPGEVVGLGGAVGAGCTALLETIVGHRRRQDGRVLLRGREVSFASPAQAAAQGVVLLPEKRSEKGLIEQLSLRENLTLPSLRRFSRLGLIRRRQEAQGAQRVVDRLRVVPPSLGFQVRNLSGGNKQKVVFGKWLLAFEQVQGVAFLFDEPTEGVDVGVKAEMWGIIRELARGGAGVVVASSELEELTALSDRIYVMRAGRLAREVRPGEVSHNDLLRLMLSEETTGEGLAAPGAGPAAGVESHPEGVR